MIYTHIPLWALYPEWGWVTSDGERALALLRRFGSVTVLNGHIHQVLQKVEGNVTFHTAMSTAFPQPSPGAAPAPGPMKVPDDCAVAWACASSLSEPTTARWPSSTRSWASLGRSEKAWIEVR